MSDETAPAPEPSTPVVDQAASVVPVADGARPNRFSKIKGKRLRRYLAMFADDLDPLNILDEIALMRAMVLLYLDENEKRVAALNAWYEQGRRAAIAAHEEAAIKRVLDQAEVYQSTDQHRKDVATVKELVSALVLARQTRPASSPNIGVEMAEILEAISRMVERIEKARSTNAISEAELNKLMSEMGRVVDLTLTDDDAKQRIRDGWVRLVTR